MDNNGQILNFHFQWYQEHKLCYINHVNIILSYNDSTYQLIGYKKWQGAHSVPIENSN